MDFCELRPRLLLHAQPLLRHWLRELREHYDPALALDTGEVARHPMPVR